MMFPSEYPERLSAYLTAIEPFIRHPFHRFQCGQISLIVVVIVGTCAECLIQVSAVIHGHGERTTHRFAFREKFEEPGGALSVHNHTRISLLLRVQDQLMDHIHCRLLRLFRVHAAIRLVVTLKMHVFLVALAIYLLCAFIAVTFQDLLII